MGFKIGEEEFEDIRVGDEYLHAVKVGEEDVWRRSGIFSADEGGALAFRENGVVLPSTFTRASQAWDGSQLVPPDTMRVFGRDTKSPVVLIEGQRTNYARGSADLTQWTLRNADGVYLPDVGPAGPWYRITSDITSGVSDIFRAVGGSGVPETGVFVFSLFVRKRTQPGQDMVMRLNGTSNPAVTVNPQTGEIVLLGSGALDAFVQDYGDSWRISLIYERVEGDTSVALIIFPFSGVSAGTGTLDIAGPQLEVSPFASSYIPTDGAPATRSRDELVLQKDVPLELLTVSFAFWAQPQSGTHGRLALARDGSNDGLRISSTFNHSFTLLRDGGQESQINVSRSQLPDNSWGVLTAVINGTTLRVYANGAFIGDTDYTLGNMVAERVIIGSYASASGNVSTTCSYSPIAPGAAALGIPLIDNRAWGAAEIQAAHARWLPELEKIEVPV